MFKIAALLEKGVRIFKSGNVPKAIRNKKVPAYLVQWEGYDEDENSCRNQNNPFAMGNTGSGC